MEKTVLQMSIEGIEKFDVISFDVFDTVIGRWCFTPRDIFYYTAQKCAKKYGFCVLPHRYLKIRQEAEISARNQSDREDISFDDIFRQMKNITQFTEEEIEHFKEEEIAAEIKFTRRREEVFKLYEYARKKNKKIVFISDMYLPLGVIRTLLEKNGYKVENNLYVSGEIGSTKGSGNLYKYVRNDIEKKLGKKVSVLHFGDNFTVDVKKAREMGFNAIFIQNVNSAIQKNKLYQQIIKPYVTEASFSFGASLMWGCITTKLYDTVEPRKLISDERMFGGSAYNLGYSALGPLLLGFTDWLIAETRKDKVDNLCFLARDGYLLYKAWEIVTEQINVNKNNGLARALYIYASRRGFTVPLLSDNSHWNLAFSSNFRGTLKKFVESRFGISMNDDSDDGYLNKEIQLNADGLKYINNFIENNKEQILNNAAEEKERLREYLNINKIEGRVGMVDLGHTGTIPYCYREMFNKDVISYNVLLTSSSKDLYQNSYSLNGKGYLLDSLPFILNGYSIHKHIPLLETLFSNDQQQFIRFEKINDGIKPLFMNESLDLHTERLKMVDEVRKGALDFVKKYCDIRTDDNDFINLDPVKASILLEYHFKKPCKEDVYIWDDVYFENNFSGWKGKAIFSSSGKYITIWDEATGLAVNNSKLPVINKFFQPDSFLDRIIYVFQGEAKAIKFQESPKRFYQESKNPLCRFIGWLM